ncbi:sensor histidine kinase N-terminal domain-containing protein, partial [Stenotrophomonas maltophilia]|uniref:sensor histidine kinase N-terminal domain-containing protein n=1 Tax=Stenotrophomonas maltophilia TaxID=40324 RepID=UPI0019542088
MADYRSYYRLRSVANGEMAGQADLPEASITAPVSFADTFYRGQKLRIASRRIDTGAGPVIVTVAETTQKHDAASWR